ncbi:hypothetical protein [Escherichia phage C6]|nr:hypothetical protein [Escherichia phage C6]
MIISAKTIDELNEKVQLALDDNWHLFGSTVVLPNTVTDNSERFFQTMSKSVTQIPGPPGQKGDKGDPGNPGDPGVQGEPGKSSYQLWIDEGNSGTVDDFLTAIAGKRRKSEVFWSGINVLLTNGATSNIISILKGIPPTAGTLSPFFRTADDKMWPYNQDRSLMFKLNLIGNFTGVSQARSITLNFVGTNGNTYTQNRPENATDILSFTTFFSIDKDGAMATNGTAITVTPNGGNFTITSALLVAEQTVTS